MIKIQENSYTKTFEGLNAYVELMNLRSKTSSKIIRQIIDGDKISKLHSKTGDMVYKIINNRVESGITLKNLISFNSKKFQLEISNHTTLKEARHMPENIQVDAMYASFDKTLTILNIKNLEKITGIVIEDVDITNTFNNLFDLIWQNSEII